MDFERVIISRVDPKQGRNEITSQHFFAEVVFLNRTHHSLNPLLYQLKSRPDLTQIAHSPQTRKEPSKKEEFSLMGEVLSVDKKKKQIYLNNQNTVSYQYLIIVSTTDGYLENTLATEDQIKGGLHTLIDALRIKDHIIIPIPIVSDKENEKTNVIKISSSNTAWSSIARRQITHPAEELVSLTLVQPNKKLYEVQL